MFSFVIPALLLILGAFYCVTAVIELCGRPELTRQDRDPSPELRALHQRRALWQAAFGCVAALLAFVDDNDTVALLLGIAGLVSGVLMVLETRKLRNWDQK